MPVSDPLLTEPPIGVDVAIYSDGLVLADDARIVHVDGPVVFVEVNCRQLRRWSPQPPRPDSASIAFVAPR